MFGGMATIWFTQRWFIAVDLVFCACAAECSKSTHPFERKDNRFTLMFEGYPMLTMANMLIAKAARVLRCDEKSLDEVRIKEQKENAEKRAIFLSRRLFIIPEKQMTNKQKTALQRLSKQYPRNGRAYRIVSADLPYLKPKRRRASLSSPRRLYKKSGKRWTFSI